VKRVEPTGCRKCGLWHDTDRCFTSGGHPLQVRSYARYAPPLSKAILELKYRPNRLLAEVMGGWLIKLYADAGWSLDVVIPVPLAFVRKQQRGYNQVELIASPFAEALDLPLDRNTLRRVRDTGTQVGLDHVARRSNLEGAFRAEPQTCTDKSIVVIDDLLTSGATMTACAEALFAAGAAAVYGLTVARAARGDTRGRLT
jgi:ComF family protein